jgi:hypothetical protein
MEVELATPTYFLNNVVKGTTNIYYEGTFFAWSETDNLFAEFKW